MKSLLVIGMGTFGTFLADKLQSLGNDVMIVDEDQETIETLAPRFTNALCADCTRPDVLRAINVPDFDICFVTIGDNFQSSLEISSQLKELGAKHVVSKANRTLQAKFLLRNGADEVIYPEKDSAERLALRSSSDGITDVIPITPEYAIFELKVKPEWVGRSLVQLDLRRRYNVNIMAIKKGDHVDTAVSPDYVFEADDRFLTVGRSAEMFKKW